MACVHEAEHRAARDTWLLFVGALLVVLTPWNAALWWQISRLRAAVELDWYRGTHSKSCRSQEPYLHQSWGSRHWPKDYLNMVDEELWWHCGEGHSHHAERNRAESGRVVGKSG